MALPSYYFPSSYKEGHAHERRIPRAGGVKKAAGEEVQRLSAGCADMGDLTAVCSPPVRFPLVIPDQNAFATTFASHPPIQKPMS